MQGVYLLHFNKEVDYENYRRYGDKTHYIGCSTQIEHRVEQHMKGEGSQMTTCALKQGITMTLAAIWPIGLVNIEQHLTRLGATQLCPICKIKATPELSTPPKQANGGICLKAKKPTVCTECGRTCKVGSVLHINAGKPRCYSHHITEIRRAAKAAVLEQEQQQQK